MDKAKIFNALVGSSQTILYLKHYGVWPEGAEQQYDNIMRLIDEAIKELSDD